MEPSEHSAESHGGGTGLKTYDSGKKPVRLIRLRAEFAFLKHRVDYLKKEYPRKGNLPKTIS